MPETGSNTSTGGIKGLAARFAYSYKAFLVSCYLMTVQFVL